MSCSDCTVRAPPLSTAPAAELPCAEVVTVTWSWASTTLSVCSAKTSPSCSCWFRTTESCGGVWLAASVAAATHSAVAAIVPARRIGAGFAIVRFRVGVGRVVAAGRADRPAARVRAGREADLGAGGAVQIGHELDRGPLDQGADRQLHRLQAALAGGHVEDVAV